MIKEEQRCKSKEDAVGAVKLGPVPYNGHLGGTGTSDAATAGKSLR